MKQATVRKARNTQPHMKALVDLKDRGLEPKETARLLTALLEKTQDSQVKCEALLFRAKVRLEMRKYGQCRQDCSEALQHDPKDILRQHLSLRVLWVQALHAERSVQGSQAERSVAGLSTWLRLREPTIDWEEVASGDSFRDYCPDLRLAVAQGNSVQLTVQGSRTEVGSVLLVERPVAMSDSLTEELFNDEETSAKLAVINGGRPVTTLAELRALMEEKGRPMRGACGDKKGLFLFGSHIGMSCNPNCVAVFVGNALVVIVTDTLLGGFSESFVPTICWIEPAWPSAARARLLRRYSRLPCKCKRCAPAFSFRRFVTSDEAETDQAAQLLEAGQVDITSPAVDAALSRAKNSSLLWQCLIRSMSKRDYVVFPPVFFRLIFSFGRHGSAGGGRGPRGELGHGAGESAGLHGQFLDGHRSY
jgi:hypothetical protein